MRICVFDSAEAHPDLAFSPGALAGLQAVVFRSADQLLAEAPDCAVLLTNAKLDLTAAKARMPSLAWVQVVSAGVEGYLPSLPPDVALTNASGVHAEKGAEFVLAAALMLNYAIPAFFADRAARVWSPNFVRPLRGKTAVILGAGAIGSAAARLLQERGMRILVVTRSGRADIQADRVATLPEMPALLGSANILVNTLPLTEETRGALGTAELALLPDSAGIVNVSRAAIFDKAALAAELRSGRLAGLVTDVFHEEPMPPADDAWDWPLTISTPHCSVDDHDGYIERCLEIFEDNVARFTSGKPLRNLVHRDRGY